MVSRDVSGPLGDLMGTSPTLVVLPDSGPFCGFIAHVLVSRDVSEARGDLMGRHQDSQFWPIGPVL